MRHTRLPNTSPNHVISPIGWFKLDGHGCHTALHFGVKAKENQDKVPTLYWLPKLHEKNPIKQDLLQILVLVQQQNFLNC